MTPVQAIRAKCLDCSAGSRVEVRLCVMPDCPLYLFRMGSRGSCTAIGSLAPRFWLSVPGRHAAGRHTRNISDPSPNHHYR